VQVSKNAGTVKVTWYYPGAGAMYQATVVTADVNCTNGVVHIIDKVLMYPMGVARAATTAGLSSLLTAVTDAGLATAVTTNAGLTIFAPTNAAFTAAASVIALLTASQVVDVLKYHVVPAVAYSTELTNNQVLPTLLGSTGASTLTVAKGSSVTLKNNAGATKATVTLTDVLTTNGVVHVIDTVMVPPNLLTIVQTAQTTPTLSTLVAVLTTPAYAPVLNTLNGNGPFTVFAPNDAAFNAATWVNTSKVADTTAVLQYHVVPGRIFASNLNEGANFAVTALPNVLPYSNLGSARTGAIVQVSKNAGTVKVTWYYPGAGAMYQATVVAADVNCSNGVVHIIDKVLMLPMGVVGAATTAGLSSLLTAVTDNGLATAVTTTAGLTIFAPTNAAFTAAANVIAALTPSQVVAVLQYHVVPAVAYSTELSNNMMVPTLLGSNDASKLTVAIGSGVTLKNNAGATLATVTLTDVLTTNGVVHVINTVMVPPSVTSGASQQMPTLALAAFLATLLALLF